MMGMTNGFVTVNDAPTKKSKLYRFCEKKIDQWAKAHSGGQIPDQTESSSLEFHVSFTEEDEQVSCMTEIHWGGSTWRGCDLAADTQMAFIHSLKRLQPH